MTALDEVAESVGAVVTIKDFEDDKDIISFDFYDDLEKTTDN